MNWISLPRQTDRQTAYPPCTMSWISLPRQTDSIPTLHYELISLPRQTDRQTDGVPTLHYELISLPRQTDRQTYCVPTLHYELNLPAGSSGLVDGGTLVSAGCLHLDHGELQRAALMHAVQLAVVRDILAIFLPCYFRLRQSQSLAL